MDFETMVLDMFTYAVAGLAVQACREGTEGEPFSGRHVDAAIEELLPEGAASRDAVKAMIETKIMRYHSAVQAVRKA